MAQAAVSAQPESARIRVDFATHPDRYRHWSLSFAGPIATLTMNVDEEGALRPGYKLKLNSYDLGVDIELHDALLLVLLAERVHLRLPGFLDPLQSGRGVINEELLTPVEHQHIVAKAIKQAAVAIAHRRCEFQIDKLIRKLTPEGLRGLLTELLGRGELAGAAPAADNG